MADKTHKMRALQTLPATASRKALKRGAEFSATDQERRDLLRDGRAEDVKAVAAKPADDGTKK